ncbi:MAG: DUF294 nucleotidyltransferase-like domain-containing protein [Pseudomonadota bacterium]
MSFGRAAGGISAGRLGSLDAIILDTETTGLNVQKDRLIEIGAVRLTSGSLDQEDIFQTLIKSDIPIPAQSSKIHGLQDKDLVDAPVFETALTDFANWAQDALWIGFSIDFDVAVFEAEHKRRDIQFGAPRILDVQELVEFLRPNLPDYALETIAGWLGVAATDRHRALADAQITGAVFLKLIPLLEAKGIRSLAQAERISDRQTGPAIYKSEPKRQIDSFAYRHNVAEVMTSPAWVAPPNARLETIVPKMVSKGYSSVFVKDGTTYGIATQNAILDQIANHVGDWRQLRLASATEFPLPLIAQDEMLYRAIDHFGPDAKRHVGVIDETGALVGAVSAKDLIGQRALDDISFDRDIRTAGSREELGTVWPNLIEVTRALLGENVEPRRVAHFISRELQALTGRACELAEMEMQAEGKGKPPVAYAMMVLGSGGRGESMLAMDQDNAIIFKGSAKDVENDVYFQQFGQKVADILDAVGVQYCKGGIMGANADWRRTDTAWATETHDWISRSQPEDILHCDIFFDALGVHGAVDMVATLQSEALAQAKSARRFLQAMAMNAAKFKAPLGLFNRLRTDEGRVDLKSGGIMPIFSAARVLALQHGVSARATPERLKGAHEEGGLDAHHVENLDAAYKIFIKRILTQQLEDLRAGLPLSNSVASRSLTDADQNELIWALKQSSEIPSLLGVPQQ